MFAIHQRLVSHFIAIAMKIFWIRRRLFAKVSQEKKRLSGGIISLNIPMSTLTIIALSVFPPKSLPIL